LYYFVVSFLLGRIAMLRLLLPLLNLMRGIGHG
jgi:hypothetical protein